MSYEGGATFIRRCEKCGRIVKANPTISVNEIHGLADKPNATCKKCGPTKMNFLGFFDEHWGSDVLAKHKQDKP